MVICEKCETENGYPLRREDSWFCRKCMHKTKIKEGDEEDDSKE